VAVSLCHYIVSHACLADLQSGAPLPRPPLLACVWWQGLGVICASPEGIPRDDFIVEFFGEVRRGGACPRKPQITTRHPFRHQQGRQLIKVQPPPSSSSLLPLQLAWLLTWQTFLVVTVSPIAVSQTASPLPIFPLLPVAGVPPWRWYEKQDGIRMIQNKESVAEFYNIWLEKPKVLPLWCAWVCPGRPAKKEWGLLCLRCDSKKP